MPKYILRIGFQEFAVPSGDGAATVMKLLADAIPIRSRLSTNELELEWADPEEAEMLALATVVSVKRIPPGTVFKRKRKDGRVEILRPVPLADRTTKKTASRRRPELGGQSTLLLQ